MFTSISHLAVKKVAFSSTLQLLQCIKVVLSLNEYIMTLMHDKKFRKEPDAKKKTEKKKKRKKERKKKKERSSHGQPEDRLILIGVCFIGTKGNPFT